MRPPPCIDADAETVPEFPERWVNKFDAMRIVGSRKTLWRYYSQGQIRRKQRCGEMVFELGELTRAKAANVEKKKAARFQKGQAGGPGRGHKGPTR
jgi:hypothetical protein